MDKTDCHGNRFITNRGIFRILTGADIGLQKRYGMDYFTIFATDPEHR